MLFFQLLSDFNNFFLRLTIGYVELICNKTNLMIGLKKMLYESWTRVGEEIGF
jgi:hypothetical protein